MSGVLELSLLSFATGGSIEPTKIEHSCGFLSCALNKGDHTACQRATLLVQNVRLEAIAIRSSSVLVPSSAAKEPLVASLLLGWRPTLVP